MVDVETLMRYIRIFSDLSSQIRYSTQKRVLVEIALIKLCRPAMETNLDSVLDRLRVLEQRMDERPVQQVIVHQGRCQADVVQDCAGIMRKRRQPAKPVQKQHRRICRRFVAQLEDNCRSDQWYFQADASKGNSEIQWSRRELRCLVC